MNNNYTYFQATNNAFWRWEDGGDVIALTNGCTIAYKGLIVQVIQSMASQGIPAFGELLLAIIATNEHNWELFYGDYWSKNKEEYSGLMVDEGVLSFQQTLAALPKEYKVGEKRLQVLRAVFEHGHNLKSRKKSVRILQLLEKDLFDREDFIMDDATDKKRLNNYRSLGLLNRRFPTPESIIKAIAGLPEIPEETPLEIVEIPQGEGEPVDFVEELTHNYKTFQVGALIKRIWSGMNIPMHAVLPNEQKLGGVADLTNKGTFDKLLISEFAYDDLTLMSRLANQEALYLNRERPPNADAQERIILIDTSIKNWGTPRTIAYAVMVAIAKHPKSKLRCRAFVLGKKSEEIAFDSVDDLIEALTHLDTNLDATEGLEAFFTNFKSTANNEVVFITLAELLVNETLKKTLLDYHRFINYIVSVNHLGEIDFYKNQQRSRKHLQHLVLPLSELWDKRNRPNPKRKNRKHKKDSISGTDFPILFPPQRKTAFLVDNKETVYAISSNNTLFQLISNSNEVYVDKGWNLISEDIPKGATILSIGQDEKGIRLLALYKVHQEKELIIVNVMNNKKWRITLDGWDGSTYGATVCFEKNKFVFQTSTKTWLLHANNANLVSEVSPKKHVAYSDAKHQQKIKVIKSSLPQFSVIRNLTSVKINNKNNLVINNHELSINAQSRIKWKRNRNHDFVEEALQGEISNSAEFKDGSIVELHNCGVLMLKSSNAQIPYIYIPTVLDQVLGVASDTGFAGLDYYLKSMDESSYSQMTPIIFYERHIKKFIIQIFHI